MSDDKKVVDFNARRKQTIEQKRRSFERVVFSEFLGVDAVIDSQGTGYPIKLVDISKEGCLLQLPYSPKALNQFKSESEISLKLFFTKGTYIPCVVTIRHATKYTDEKGEVSLRLGTEFDTSLPSFKAVSSFIDFIYQYAEFSCVDTADKAFFL